MNKKELKDLKKSYKHTIKNMDATSKQAIFLLNQYQDEECIIGIHNTFQDHEYFFESGLHNYTSLNQPSTDLSNTVMYSDNLRSLMPYPNGDGKKRGNTAIILKIPKKVFSHEQGIFETLSDGYHGIPPEFIVAAFQHGEIIPNEKYDKNYYSENAIKCIDTIHLQDRALHSKAFQETYNAHYKEKNSWKNRFLNFIANLKNNKNTLSLPSGKEPSHATTKDARHAFLAELRKNTPTNINPNIYNESTLQEQEKTEKETETECR